MTAIQATHMDAQQQLPSYIEQPSDASSIFAIWPITSVPPGSEKWTWHEQTMQVLGFTGLVYLPENNADMLAFIQNLMNVLPHQSRIEERLLVSDEVVDEARAWAEEDGRQAIRFVRQHTVARGVDPNRNSEFFFRRRSRSSCGDAV